MQTLESLDFRPLLRGAVSQGLDAAAVVDVDGKILAVTGVVDGIDARAFVAVTKNCMESADLLTRMLDGENVDVAFDTRTLSLGIAARCVFVVAVPNTLVYPDAFKIFQYRVERLISDARADFSGARALTSGSGGSSSGPAGLPVVEWGITVPRKPS